MEQLAIKPLDGVLSSPYAAKVSGKTYHLLKNREDFSKISVEFLDTASGILRFTLHETNCELEFGLGSLECGIFPMYNMKYVASAEWLSEDTLYIRVHIIDSYVGSVHFELTFGETDVTVFLKKVEESLFNEFNGHLYGTC